MFGFTGRGNIRAWEYALFEGKNEFLALADVKLYAYLTEQQIANDCPLSWIAYRFIKVRKILKCRKCGRSWRKNDISI